MAFNSGSKLFWAVESDSNLLAAAWLAHHGLKLGYRAGPDL